MKLDRVMLLILLIDGLLWFRSGWGKVSGGKFVSELPKTLERFASQNPYSWYKDFLQTVSLNNNVFGTLVMYGELIGSTLLLVGIVTKFLEIQSRYLTSLIVITLLGLSFMNLNFYLAAGWTSPSTEGLNLLMMAIQLGAAFKLVADLRR